MNLLFVFLGIGLFALVVIVIEKINEMSDSYRGVTYFSETVRDVMNCRRLGQECLDGHGPYCSRCCRYEECRTECEDKVKKAIDAEIERGGSVK